MSGARAETIGYVYFAAPIGGGNIKIGFSSTPQDRVNSGSCWSPYPLELLAAASGTLADELHLHNRFADAHVHLEWFRPVADLLALIAGIRSTGKLPDSFRGRVGERSALWAARRTRQQLRPDLYPPDEQVEPTPEPQRLAS